ncbi:MAG: ribonuclease P protein component [Lachnospiraceae bacterium]|nr:ribonuclease P protein component [Lachnospiraceae bacterium]
MQYSVGLKKNSDFSRVYKTGRSKSDKYLVLYARENGLPVNRLGVVVSKKVGNSVVRHRLKRLVKENYRLAETSYKTGYDLVVVLRRGAADADFHRIGHSLSFLTHLQKLTYENETACESDHQVTNHENS